MWRFARPIQSTRPVRSLVEGLEARQLCTTSIDGVYARQNPGFRPITGVTIDPDETVRETPREETAEVPRITRHVDTDWKEDAREVRAVRTPHETTSPTASTEAGSLPSQSISRAPLPPSAGEVEGVAGSEVSASQPATPTANAILPSDAGSRARIASPVFNDTPINAPPPATAELVAERLALGATESTVSIAMKSAGLVVSTWQGMVQRQVAIVPVVYRFARVNANELKGSFDHFINECAAIPPALAGRTTLSRAQAWLITAMVVAVDAIAAVYLVRRVRRGKKPSIRVRRTPSRPNDRTRLAKSLFEAPLLGE